MSKILNLKIVRVALDNKSIFNKAFFYKLNRKNHKCAPNLNQDQLYLNFVQISGLLYLPFLNKYKVFVRLKNNKIKELSSIQIISITGGG